MSDSSDYATSYQLSYTTGLGGEWRFQAKASGARLTSAESNHGILNLFQQSRKLAVPGAANRTVKLLSCHGSLCFRCSA